MGLRCCSGLVLLAVMAAALAALGAGRQKPLPPISQPPAIGPQVPSGTGGCSVTTPDCAQVAPAIVRSALGASPLSKNLRTLTDVVGGRVTGSPSAARAVDWAITAFRKAGVDDVHPETYAMPVGWAAGNPELNVVAAQPFPVLLASAGWSPPTPPKGIEAGLLDVGRGTPADFAANAQKLQGSILLVHTKILGSYEDLFNEYGQQSAVVPQAVRAGAKAILWMASRPYRIVYRLQMTMNGQLGPIPEAVVAREDAERLARFLESGTTVRVRLSLPNRVSGPFQAANVIAEIRGREKPNEYVVLAAHLDSWELGTGALDNGCNAAMVIDAARAIHAAGARPRRSIRFILFTGEEQGMLGSWAYVRSHRDEMDRVDAVIVYDAGIGRVTGYELGGRQDIETNLRAALQPAARLAAGHDTPAAEMGTDNFDFLLEGVPNLVANQEPANYMINYHADTDTFDKIDIAELKRHVALAALTAYGIADLPQRLGPRQTRPQIERLLDKAGLASDMKQQDVWPLWSQGRRGRRP
ncbi:MAG TPA: M20/M25/M40 family metallo-hydrolase [Candidatus Acidoferrales bacterium]|nr:M20/M25/M40 family metallo-hydrolase [Candidatus Acidoferrales bacterium]